LINFNNIITGGIKKVLDMINKLDSNDKVGRIVIVLHDDNRFS